MKLRCVLLLAALTVSCGYSSNYNGGGMGNGALHIDALVPNSTTAGDPAFTLTVNGRGFTPTSVVYWNAGPRTTTFVMANQITAQIPAADVATMGTATVYVRTTGGMYGGGTNSNNVSFTVN